MFRKVLCFGSVGVIGAIVDFSTKALLLHLGAPGVFARGGSYIVGSTVAYYLNSYLTFSGERSVAEKARAAASYVVCLTAAVLVDWLIGHVFPSMPGILFWSWFVSQGVATTLNFLLQNFWVFRPASLLSDRHGRISPPGQHE
ncbi:Putative membrane protein [Corynebacterium glyciniphilum AJ 3170]|uniref:Putative membrane protein n=1 Tax=Corynebacterium glyciniphilum AJ 3170 TaxID=1404245 RepID=X5E839_9CORY|nr:GtrA family protein [Corynebacterium glyciniphilum]AHW62811.1 Putative membrane protein [Corynebacterium glyciniphilum AJ 3170]